MAGFRHWKRFLGISLGPSTNAPVQISLMGTTAQVASGSTARNSLPASQFYSLYCGKEAVYYSPTGVAITLAFTSAALHKPVAGSLRFSHKETTQARIQWLRAPVRAICTASQPRMGRQDADAITQPKTAWLTASNPGAPGWAAIHHRRAPRKPACYPCPAKPRAKARACTSPMGRQKLSGNLPGNFCSGRFPSVEAARL